MNCPECGEKLDGSGTNYRCGECGTLWEVSFRCEKCKNVPTLMASCGSASFFCESCKVLKSRETMDKTFKKRE